MDLSVADAVESLAQSCRPKVSGSVCEFVFTCLVKFHSIYSIFEMLSFHSSQLNCYGGILQMFLIRGVLQVSGGDVQPQGAFILVSGKF